jgi:KaiC/GvpD/RAD55 family RecA-like ATPase
MENHLKGINKLLNDDTPKQKPASKEKTPKNNEDVVKYLIDDQFLSNNLMQEDYEVADSPKEAVLKYLRGKTDKKVKLKKGKGDDINIKATPVIFKPDGTKYFHPKKRALWFLAEFVNENQEPNNEAKPKQVDDNPKKLNFIFQEPMSETGSRFIKELEKLGATNVESKENKGHSPNTMNFEYKDRKYYLLDNGFEFKMDDITGDRPDFEYLVAIPFPDVNINRTNRVKYLADKVIDVADERSKKMDSPEKEKSRQKKKPSPKKKTATKKQNKPKKKVNKAVNKTAVNHYSESFKLLRRLRNFLRKDVVSFRQIQLLYMAFSKAAIEKKLDQNDPYYDLYKKANDVVVKMYKVADEKKDSYKDTGFNVVDTESNIYKKINDLINSKKIDIGVRLTKRFVNIQGTSPDKARAKRLLKSIENAIDKDNIKEGNRLFDEVKKARKELNDYIKNDDPIEVTKYSVKKKVADKPGMSGAKPRSVKEIMKINVSQRRKGHSVPMGASLNAQKAIDWLEKYGRKEVTAGTKVGLKRAYQLANGIKLTDDEVKKMAQFNRHRKNSRIADKYKDTPWKDNGYVAWLLWGGDTGVDWAIEKSKELQKEKDDPGMKGVNVDLSDTVKKTADDIMITADQVKEFANRTKETVDAVKKVSTRKKNADSRISNLKGKKGDKDYQFFNVAGQTGQFLQNVERKPKESIAITLDGPQGSGKTTTVWKMMNDFAGGGNDVLFLSLEEHPESFLVQDKINLYIDDDNLDRIDMTGDVDSKEHLYKLIEGYDIIFLDSWQKLLEYVGKIKFDQDLRKKVDSKVFVVIFQQTVQGKTKGGADIGFDGDIIIKLHKDESGNFANNYAYFDKHRYTKKPIDKLKYYIASGQFVDETQQQPAPTEQAQPYNNGSDDLVVSL